MTPLESRILIFCASIGSDYKGLALAICTKHGAREGYDNGYKSVWASDANDIVGLQVIEALGSEEGKKIRFRHILVVLNGGPEWFLDERY